MNKKKLFLASSAELEADRREFEILIARKNREWVERGVFLELVLWEDFLDAVSKTRLQDEYNRVVRECDIFVMLFFTRVGKYTEEEFDVAFGQFQAANKPFIFTYFKDAQEVSLGSVNDDDLVSFLAFRNRLSALGHFPTVYKNVDALKLHFNQQLDKLVANGFIEFNPAVEEGATAGGDRYQANLTGSGSPAQGAGATAVGAGGISIGGNNSGILNTGILNAGIQMIDKKKIDTQGGAYVGGSVTTGGDFVGRDKITHGISPNSLESLFVPLLTSIKQQAPPDVHADVEQQVDALKTELSKNDETSDGMIATIVQGLVDKVPAAISHVISLFASPILGGIAGPLTRSVLDKLKGSHENTRG